LSSYEVGLLSNYLGLKKKEKLSFRNEKEISRNEKKYLGMKKKYQGMKKNGLHS